MVQKSGTERHFAGEEDGAGVTPSLPDKSEISIGSDTATHHLRPHRAASVVRRPAQANDRSAVCVDEIRQLGLIVSTTE